MPSPNWLYQPSAKSVNHQESQREVHNCTAPKAVEQSSGLFCCHRQISIASDSPWAHLVYSFTHGKILHEPPHDIKRLSILMRQAEFLIRVESPSTSVFLVQSADGYAGLHFVEVDRQTHYGLTEELPEWLRGVYVPDLESVLEWRCKDHRIGFRCTAFSRKTIGSAWW